VILQNPPSTQRQSTVNQQRRTKLRRRWNSFGKQRAEDARRRLEPVVRSVRVLGEVAIAHDGIALPLPASLRAVALLRWLAVHVGSLTRSEIASSLWPDVHYAIRRRVDVADSPLRFPEWWTGIESTTVGGDGDYTIEMQRGIITSALRLPAADAV
jgi:hypothetical protein